MNSMWSAQSMARAGSLCSAMFYTLLMVAISPSAGAQTLSTDYQGWRITIDESPSQEFVTQALADLQDFLEFPDPPSSFHGCCFGVGNYGVAVDIDEGFDDSVLFRRADDLDENGIAFPAFAAAECDEHGCKIKWFFGGEFSSPQHFLSVFSIITDLLPAPTYPEPINPNSVPTGLTNSVGLGQYPLFVGPLGVTDPLPDVWMVTFSPAPEPTTVIQGFWALSVLVMRWGRFRLAHRA